MAKFKKSILALLSIVVLIGSVMGLGSPVYASSAYDDIVQPVDRLLLIDPANPLTCREDLSTNWESEFERLSTLNPIFMQRGAWVVSSEFNSSGQPIAAHVAWWNDGSMRQATFGSDRVTFDSLAWAAKLTLDSATCTLKFTIVSLLTTVPPRFSQGELYRPFLSENVNFTYPVDYAGELIPGNVSPSTLEYVGLGDSFSAGVGTFNYDLSSGCQRSSDSYVPFVAEVLSYDLTVFVACGGATTKDLFNANGTISPQFDSLEASTDRVTLTIGGNDVGFSEVLDACMKRPGESVKGYGCSGTTIASTVNGRLAKLNGQTGATATAPGGREIKSIRSVIDEIAELSPQASIYVGGYPSLFGEDVSDYVSHGSQVYEAHCGALLVNIEYPDALWMNSVGEELNEVIESAVDAASLDGVDVTFVPATNFDGHALCDSQQQWINQFGLDAQTGEPLTESFHPTPTGWIEGYGYAFVSEMG